MCEIAHIAKHYPNITQPKSVEKINYLPMTHPSRGQKYQEFLVNADGIKLNFVNIQKILEREFSAIAIICVWRLKISGRTTNRSTHIADCFYRKEESNFQGEPFSKHQARRTTQSSQLPCQLI